MTQIITWVPLYLLIHAGEWMDNVSGKEKVGPESWRGNPLEDSEEDLEPDEM